jgi:hypothetical protein
MNLLNKGGIIVMLISLKEVSNESEYHALTSFNRMCNLFKDFHIQKDMTQYQKDRLANIDCFQKFNEYSSMLRDITIEEKDLTQDTLCQLQVSYDLLIHCILIDTSQTLQDLAARLACVLDTNPEAAFKFVSVLFLYLPNHYIYFYKNKISEYRNLYKWSYLK